MGVEAERLSRVTGRLDGLPSQGLAAPLVLVDPDLELSQGDARAIVGRHLQGVPDFAVVVERCSVAGAVIA
ncbi:hypothetical protein OG453_38040 [Streptomyces sp. NBC_01381]|uniref:hypothetical protein n=1 Tax=Streptomyces sp. NBC_01381 TaxID=2903845 RepID=UPI00224D89B7|nr:hypothetical protein [Streptomyces sp. NBC_01381]MCX4672395.1 hypothetical protein [Streptomyces sp. NBC_01381]